ncbi:hypothetical protein D3C71_2215470 [compost metagenome]
MSARSIETVVLTFSEKSTNRIFTVPDCAPLTLLARVLNTDSRDFLAASTPDFSILPEVSTMNARL